MTGFAARASSMRDTLDAFCALAYHRAALWVAPYDKLSPRLRPAGPESADREALTRITRSIERARRWIPQSTCLVEALSARYLLCRRGIPSDLCIGVRRNSHGGLEAHAWLRVGEQTLMGGPELSTYAVLSGKSAQTEPMAEDQGAASRADGPTRTTDSS